MSAPREALKPCPFCGGKATCGTSYWHDEESLYGGRLLSGCWVFCESCGCEMGRGSLDSQEEDIGMFQNFTEATQCWNRRATPDSDGWIPVGEEMPTDALLQFKSQRVIDHKATGSAWRATREKNGISLREVARRMGFSAPYISDLEQGKRLWTEKKARAYHAALASTTEAQP